MDNILQVGTCLRNGKYTIVKILGQGSFGITYLATTEMSVVDDNGINNQTIRVALKEFFMSEINVRGTDGKNVEGTSGTMTTGYRQRFRKEAENLGRLNHRGIVRVMEVFEENNTVYYAMEFVDGESLDDYIEREGCMREYDALLKAKEMAEALDYMHSQGMLHLDLKPRNVMVAQSGHLILIDFGLSKQYDGHGEPESSTNIGMGTPGYAPIEQAGYRPSGRFPATLDVYAFGATCYKMLTGVRPPMPTDILNAGFPESVFVNQGVSDDTISLVRKAMSPTPRGRYQSVREIMVDLDRCIEKSKSYSTTLDFNASNFDFHNAPVVVSVSDKNALQQMPEVAPAAQEPIAASKDSAALPSVDSPAPSASPAYQAPLYAMPTKVQQKKKIGTATWILIGVGGALALALLVWLMIFIVSSMKYM